MGKEQNIEVLILGSAFMIILLIFLIVMVFGIKKWVFDRDKYYKQKHDDLQDEVNGLKRIIIESFDKKINQIKK